MPSVLEMFKIGIGPSSSHTLGPMKAAAMFINQLSASGSLDKCRRIVIDLYGSLSLTGMGHKTDQAILLGLAGYEPETVVIEDMPRFMDNIISKHALALANQQHDIYFDINSDIIFHQTFLPCHENGMRISAFSSDGPILSETYYSIGGGVVVTEETFGHMPENDAPNLPHPFNSASQLLDLCERSGLTISALAMENELAIGGPARLASYCRNIWQVMRECMERGMHAQGVLPGPMRVARRAPGLRIKLKSLSNLSNDPLMVLDWVTMYALAVSEENAAGGRVVTAPTNGACGVIPAVLAYYDKFISPLDDEALQRFFLASGAIGLLYRMNASISGAEVGCQGEVGVACSMAAAGLAELVDGAPPRVCAAAEIGMEHNLGLTCDPVGGQVQIPCIERNAVNAIKAINAARMAMERMNMPVVSLDNVIEAMYNTGKDMNAKYRETSQGGLAAIPRFIC